jgi:hypothetical protein
MLRVLHVGPGEDKCHPGPKLSEQSPVLTRYRKRNTGNIPGYPPSCGEPHGEATDSKFEVAKFELRKPLANPDMERTEEKKAVV